MTVDLDTAHVLTRLVMAGSFASAAAATAWRRRWGFTLFYVLAAIETYAKLRYPASALARQLLVGPAPSDSAKYAVQVAILMAAALIGAGILLVLLVRLYRTPARLTLALGTLGVLAVFAVETISYHFSDRIIYTVQGGIMRAGWMYAVAAWVATAGALRLPLR